MAAPYRFLQSDFSAGQIDRMVEANMNLAYKTIGLKESFNTIHNANKTVSKRPATEFYCGPDAFDISDNMGKADILLPDGHMVMLAFDKEHTFLFCGGEKYESSVHIDAEGPYHTAVYQNFLYVVGPHVPLIKIFQFGQTGEFGTDDYTVTMTPRTLDWTNKPSCVKDDGKEVNFNTCLCAGGRLFLAYKNTIYFSRVRVVGEPDLLEEPDSGFPKWTLDFKLSDTITPEEGGGNSTTVINSSHAYEGRENDMYSSEIKWMSNMGRIVIGTGAGIFMSTTQGIDPLTFDTVMTSSYGTADVQPILVSNMLFFLASDRRKIYSAYFSSDYQGLIIGDVTANERDMFYKGIKSFWAFDYPEISVYAVTDDGRMFYCQPSAGQSGLIFAWSEWRLPRGEKFKAVFHERLTDDPFHQICAIISLTDEVRQIAAGPTGNSVMMIVKFIEPYNDDTSRPMMDYMYTADSTDIEITGRETTIKNIKLLSEGQVVTVFITHPGNPAPIVLRNLKVSGGKIQFTMPKPKIDGFYDKDGTAIQAKGLKFTYGVEYTSRIGLFQQLLPNNSGIALSSKHYVKNVIVSVYRSFGGALEVAGRKTGDLPYLTYGSSSYSAEMYNFTDSGVYCFTGELKMSNPRYIGPDNGNLDRNNPRDNVVLVLDRPFPFNLMAVFIEYIITEVN